MDLTLLVRCAIADRAEAERLGREITEQWDDVQTSMYSLYEILDNLFKSFRFYSDNYDKVYNWLREAELVAKASETQKLVRTFV